MSLTQLEQILEVLEANPEGLCDACVREITKLVHQNVNANCLRAEVMGKIKRNRDVCPSCNRLRQVSVPHSIQAGRLPLSIPRVASRSMPPITPDWFEQTRRRLVQTLNEIDDKSKGEPFSRRVAALRNEGRIPANTASLMLTFTSFRNIVCFDKYILSESEEKIVRLAGDDLEEWLKTRR